MPRLVAEHKGMKVYAHGSDVDPKFKKGKKVAIPESLVKKQQKKLNGRGSRFNAPLASQTRQGDSMFERVFESDNTLTVGAAYDTTSLADFFPVDRRCGFATSIKLNMQRRIAPSIATQVCCATDIPIISVEKKVCSEYTGFVNLAVAADTCVWDNLAAEENGVNLLDDEYLPAINEALTIGSNIIAVEGDDENNVLGLRNNPYIPTVVTDSPSVVNPVVSFRRIAQFVETRDNSIIDLSNTFNKTYTLFIPMSLAMSLANSTVSFANNQVSLLSILAGVTGNDANDMTIPKFNIFAFEHLENHWKDNLSDVAYLFASDTSGFNEMSRWWKPFSFLELGSETKGLREQNFFGARVGSIEFLDLTKAIRIVIPKV